MPTADKWWHACTHRHRGALRAERNLVMRINVKQHPVHGKFVRRRAERFWLLYPRPAVEDVYEQPKAVPIEAVVDSETVGWGGAEQGAAAEFFARRSR